jgi:hypothetical protein
MAIKYHGRKIQTPVKNKVDLRNNDNYLRVQKTLQKSTWPGFNLAALYKFCHASIDDIGAHIIKNGGTQTYFQGQRYWYIPGSDNAKVLMVGHADTVSTDMKTGAVPSEQPFYYQTDPKTNRPEVVSLSMDDRMGLFTIMWVLPQFGLDYDILITEDEESGMSSASLFDPPKQYNWAGEFDRSGDDVVMYDYHNDDNVALLQEAGFKVGYGSFTDICYLETQLNASAFNFGTGYYRAHTTSCYVDIIEWWGMVQKFIAFFNNMKDTHIPYSPKKYTVSAGRYLTVPSYSYDSDGWYEYRDAYKDYPPKEHEVSGDYDECWNCEQRFYTPAQRQQIQESDYGVCTYCEQYLENTPRVWEDDDDED